VKKGLKIFKRNIRKHKKKEGNSRSDKDQENGKIQPNGSIEIDTITAKQGNSLIKG
jgi:hypothetical protein